MHVDSIFYQDYNNSNTIDGIVNVQFVVRYIQSESLNFKVQNIIAGFNAGCII